MTAHTHYDEEEIRALHNQGKSQHAIAERLGVSQSTLSHKMAAYPWFAGKLGVEFCECCGIRRKKKGFRKLCQECFRENSE